MIISKGSVTEIGDCPSQLNQRLSLLTQLQSLWGKDCSGTYRIPIIFSICWVKLRKMIPVGHNSYPSSVLEKKLFIVLCISQPFSFPGAHWQVSEPSPLYHLRKKHCQPQELEILSLQRSPNPDFCGLSLPCLLSG